MAQGHSLTQEATICNLYSITTNQAAIAALFRVINRYVGNLAPMPGVFPDYPAPVVRNADAGTEMVTMRWGMPPPARLRSPTSATRRRRTGGLAEAGEPLSRRSIP
jgi:putative SOS response-associated peptidase YedK